MSTTFDEFTANFQVPELTVVRTRHWTWSVRPIQATLGAGVLSLNRFSTSLADLTADEGADLSVIVPRVDGALRRWIAPDKMNYLMLMMVDAHVHFHVLPRFAHSRTFAGVEWVDRGWPAQPQLNANADFGDVGELQLVRDTLRRQLD